jgi:hypothetical protein
MTAKSVACILTNADNSLGHEAFVDGILTLFLSVPITQPVTTSEVGRQYRPKPTVAEFEYRVLELLEQFALSDASVYKEWIDTKLFDAWPAGPELGTNAATLTEGDISPTGYHLMSEKVSPAECVTKAHNFLYRFVEELVLHGRVVQIPLPVGCPCGHFTASLIPRLMDHFVTTSCTSSIPTKH